MKVSFHLRGPAGLPPSFEHGGPLIRIGRDPQLELSFSGSAAELVSWRHARIELSADGACVSDLGSTNGTYLNHRRLSERAALKVGDRIQLGQSGPLLEVAVLDLKEKLPPSFPPVKAPQPIDRRDAGPTTDKDRRDAGPTTDKDRRDAGPTTDKDRRDAGPTTDKDRRDAGPTTDKIDKDRRDAGPTSKPASSRSPGATPVSPPAMPRRLTGATLFVGLVSSMQRRQRKVFLAIGAAVFVLAGLVGYLLWKPAPAPTATPLSGQEIYNRVVRSTAWVVVAGMKSMGTGTLIDKEQRLLLTAYHVVLGHEDEEIFVFFPAFDTKGEPIEKREYYTSWRYPYQDFIHVRRIVKKHPEHDLVLLELERVPQDVPPLPLAESSPRPGEQVHTVGNPGASQLWKYTQGVVGQVSEIEDPPYRDQRIKAWMIVTQAPINHGDSGGPLVNDAGQLVGVNSSGLAEAQQINRCIDIREVKALLDARP
ncbi:MAG TPA: trypsin-like peptidase domain-containing protein [Gemmataceae bacterium]|nr:trypsin-like peptidase domain-containing protein [Gemmataceae bacterium]